MLTVLSRIKTNVLIYFRNISFACFPFVCVEETQYILGKFCISLAVVYFIMRVMVWMNVDQFKPVII